MIAKTGKILSDINRLLEPVLIVSRLSANCCETVSIVGLEALNHFRRLC